MKQRVCAYARVSSNSSSQEHSFNFQSDYWNRVLSQNPDFEYVGLYADKGISGKFAERRPQFMSMVNAVKDGQIDIVIGTHPHRLQPIEYYNGHYIAYSLSNFVFGGNTSLGDPDTCILQCEFVMDETNTYVESYNINVIPYRQTTKYPGNDYCPMPYDWSSDDYYRVLDRLDWSQEDE